MIDPGTGPGLAAGDRVGGFEVVRPLSHGAMGEVYEARPGGGGEARVALKRCLDPENEERFEIEGRLLAALSHPRVVTVLDTFQHAGTGYLVMELIDGRDLNAELDQRGDPGLPVDEAIGHVAHVCEALAYVHAQQVVHRDVKPANVILADRGPVLVDFGIAREFTGWDEGTIAIGTPGFMAPEVMNGGIVTPRSDIYATAALLWTLLTGRPPRYGEPEPISWSAAGVPDAIERALRRALVPEPEDRTPSIRSFADDLGAALAGGGVSLARSVPEATVPRTLLEALVRAAAGVFEAAAASLALTDPRGGLRYEAAWGAGAAEIVGVRLPAGRGIAGAVAERGEGLAIPDCRSDARFAADVAEGTGYVPVTMLSVPLLRGSAIVGVLSVLDRRDGRRYGPADVDRAAAFGDLAVLAVEREGTVGA
jgi:predicted Ser/Thr protein kinase